MDISIKNSSISESTLIWAIVCSILLHLLLVISLPNFKFDAIKKIPDVLKVELIQPKKPEPVVIAEPPKPVEPIKPQPEQIKHLPKKELKPEPRPIETKPEPTQAEPPPPPAVITATPKVDVPPVITVPPPPPEPLKEKPLNDEAYNAAKNSYRSNVEMEIQRNLRYPKLAEKRHIIGKAKVEIYLDKVGNVISVTVISSSGNASLDAEAVAVIKRSDLKQYMNETLADRINPLTIPISFTLP